MLGPVFRRELSSAARGSRLHGLRWLYGLLVLAQLLTFVPPVRLGPDGVIRGWRFADLHAELLFWRIAVQQVALLLVCTPAFAAGAFTAEKVRGTLLPLFLTPLTSWQIVCDKFLARLAQLLLLSLTSVPALAAAAALWEGESVPVWPVAVAVVGPLALVTAVSLLASVWTRTTAEATFSSYLLLAAMVGVVVGGGDALRPLSPTYVLDPELIVPSKRSLAPDAGEGVLITRPLPPSMLPPAVLAERARTSGLCWGVAALACLVLASWRLKPAYFAQLALPDHGLGWGLTTRPPVGERPCFWREVHIKGVVPWRLFRGLPSYLLWIATSVGTGCIAALDLWEPTAGRNCVLLCLGWAVLTPMLVLLRCTAAVVLDRDPLIWEAIQTTPLESKWVVRDTLQGVVAACLRGASAPALGLLVVGAVAGFYVFTSVLFAALFVLLAVYAAGAAGLSLSFRGTRWDTLLEGSFRLLLPILPLLTPFCCLCSLLAPLSQLLWGNGYLRYQEFEGPMALLPMVSLGVLAPFMLVCLARQAQEAVSHLERRRAVVAERPGGGPKRAG